MRIRIALAALLLATSATAQQPTEPQDTTGQTLIDDREAERAVGPLTDPLPPPDMDDPGVETAPEDVPPAGTDAAAQTDRDALPEKVQAPPDGATPDVTIRTDPGTGDRIEEYRENGRLVMVKVTPERGPPYMLLDTNGDGTLDRTDGEGPVRPVYWTIYEWD